LTVLIRLIKVIGSIVAMGPRIYTLNSCAFARQRPQLKETIKQRVSLLIKVRCFCQHQHGYRLCILHW